MNLFILLGLFLFVSSCSSLFLNVTDGGYDVVVQIRPDVAVESSEEANSLLKNMRDSLIDTSINMWEATNKSLYLRSVELVIPDDVTWNMTELEAENICVETSGKSSVSPGDIRIIPDEEGRVPRVENPKLCALPGDFIELPANFFDNKTFGSIKNLWKPFLALWARYRWGVWEEHGYPLDDRFPYAYDNNGSPTLTACNDKVVTGDFKDGKNETCYPIEVENCSFNRTGDSKPISSLMHFYWLESVTQFCDSSNHRRDAQNKQNLFCNYQSAMEVILKGADYRSLNNSEIKSNYGSPTFTCVKQEDKIPLLYILIDHGKAELPKKDYIMNHLMSSLYKFISDLHDNVYIGVGSYPRGLNDSRAEERISFRNFEENEELFESVIFGDRIDVASTPRNFPAAILQVADIVRTNAPTRETVLLVISTGVALNDKAFPYEKKIEIALKHSNIRLVGLEVLAEGEDPSLEYLSELSGGSLNLKLESGGDVTSPSTVDFFEDLSKKFEQGSPNNDSPMTKPIVTWEGMLDSNKSNSFLVASTAKALTFNLVTASSQDVPCDLAVCENIQAYVLKDGELQPIQINANISSRMEYGPMGSQVPSELLQERLVHTWEWLEGDLPVNQAEHNITIHFLSKTNSQAYLIVTVEEEEDNPFQVNVDVSTSVFNNSLDLLYVIQPEAPFVVYAHVTSDDISVSEAQVTAYIQGPFTNVSSVAVTLKDDGLYPDLFEHDGVYSQVYIPSEDGFYTVTVNVTGSDDKGFNRTASLAPSSYFQHGSGLLPPDQQFSKEVHETLPRVFQHTVGMPGMIRVQNSEKYTPVLTKVRDFKAALLSSGENTRLKFEFTQAAVLTNKAGPVYVCYSVIGALTENVDSLYNYRNSSTRCDKNDLTPPVGLHVERQFRQLFPYNETVVKLNWENATQNGTFYFGVMVTAYDAQIAPASMSNLVRLTIDNAYDPPPPPASPATTESPSTTTTEASSPSTDPKPPTEALPESTTNLWTDPLQKPWVQTTTGIVVVTLIVLLLILAITATFIIFRRRFRHVPNAEYVEEIIDTETI